MKKAVLLLAIIAISLSVSAQVSTHHLFGRVTTSDVLAYKKLKAASPTSISFFLRPVISESAYEIPLKSGLSPEYFAATGIGLSVAGYGLKDNVAVEKFAINAILFADNTTAKFSSAALGVGVPIPILSLPDLNVGLRYDWTLKVFYLQTGVTVEF